MSAAEQKAYNRHMELISDNGGASVEHTAVYTRNGDFVGGSFSMGSKNHVEGTIKASRYLRWHSDAISIHNHPKTWLPSPADYNTAAKYSINKSFIIHTSPNAANPNAMYQYGERGGFLGFFQHRYEQHVFY